MTFPFLILLIIFCRKEKLLWKPFEDYAYHIEPSCRKRTVFNLINIALTDFEHKFDFPSALYNYFRHTLIPIKNGTN